ncbi:MAG: toll/interleukin-1 receptor domain-containing protein [Chloroflexota bacterium]|nr:toll/interleukin-1 receptor domain-containing protein [Chloroflexota bacterium]
MADDAKFALFIERVTGRPLPHNAMARVRTLAKELAEGAAEGHWETPISHFRGMVNKRSALVYLLARWSKPYENAPVDVAALRERVETDDVTTMAREIFDTGNAPLLSLLINNGYMTADQAGYHIQKAAFDLLEETEPANIFISYRRKDSSAFALLVLARLKAAGLEPFLDLALVPGEDWRAGLRERIQRYDYFIALLGPETLTSSVVIEEIQWALEYKLTIIPIWHSGFNSESPLWVSLPANLREALQMRHTIRVLEENPLAYNNALVELLNRFGVTP